MSKSVVFGGARTMWVIAMFDLPVVTKADRKNYTKFRTALLTSGFMMLQFSVYGRPCPSEEAAQKHIERIERKLPPDGQVRLICLTDMQFSRMKIYYGKKRQDSEPQPEQLSFF